MREKGDERERDEGERREGREERGEERGEMHVADATWYPWRVVVAVQYFILFNARVNQQTHTPSANGKHHYISVTCTLSSCFILHAKVNQQTCTHPQLWYRKHPKCVIPATHKNKNFLFFLLMHHIWYSSPLLTQHLHHPLMYVCH